MTADTAALSSPRPENPSAGDARALVELWRASSASEKAYRHAVEAVDSEPFRFSLGDMLERHRQLSSWLADEIRARGIDTPEADSFWGNVLVFLERIGAAVGQRACLSVLQAGEIQSLKQARSLVEDVSDGDLARWIEEEWIPAVEENRGELDSMLYALWTT